MIKEKHLKSGPIVVAGSSAGGLNAFKQLIGQLPEDFPAPLLLVQHISGDASGNSLLDALNKSGKLKCMHAAHGLQVRAGHVYLAPSDHHIMIDKTGCLIQYGRLFIKVYPVKKLTYTSSEVLKDGGILA
jgi:two-component system, chemotaxis family, protein-glutamate methylesterase/glutaminase